MQESNIPGNSRPDFSGSVEINNQQQRPVDSETIRATIVRILGDSSFRHGEISVAIVDDKLMQELNRKYLDHDYPTDVLSFVLERDDHGVLYGEIIVSAETAQTVAEEMQHRADDELLLYVIHGALHLVGFDDKTPEDKLVMSDAESRYLRLFGISGLSSTAIDKAEETRS